MPVESLRTENKESVVRIVVVEQRRFGLRLRCLRDRRNVERRSLDEVAELILVAGDKLPRLRHGIGGVVLAVLALFLRPSGFHIQGQRHAELVHGLLPHGIYGILTLARKQIRLQRAGAPFHQRLGQILPYLGSDVGILTSNAHRGAGR